MPECRFNRSERVKEAPQWQMKGFSFVSAFLLISFGLSLSHADADTRVWAQRNQGKAEPAKQGPRAYVRVRVCR